LDLSRINHLKRSGLPSCNRKLLASTTALKNRRRSERTDKPSKRDWTPAANDSLDVPLSLLGRYLALNARVYEGSSIDASGKAEVTNRIAGQMNNLLFPVPLMVVIALMVLVSSVPMAMVRTSCEWNVRAAREYGARFR
jgi:hypothetical protein